VIEERKTLRMIVGDRKGADQSGGTGRGRLNGGPGLGVARERGLAWEEREREGEGERCRGCEEIDASQGG
jgi:hypothetical protein